MAEQTAIDYKSLEWKDDAAGGTPIEAAALNRMEQGIADACAGVDQLRTKRLPTYLVAQDGDTATQDLYLETILGPCLILDLAERATYYDNGEAGEGHERTLITSGSDIDALRDSLSHVVRDQIYANIEVKNVTISAGGITDVEYDFSDNITNTLIACVYQSADIGTVHQNIFISTKFENSSGRVWASVHNGQGRAVTVPVACSVVGLNNA